MRRDESFDAALVSATHRIIGKAMVFEGMDSETLKDAVRDLIKEEAPDGIPLEWVMYIRDIAAALSDEGTGPEGQPFSRRIGDAIVEVIDEGEVENF